MPGRERRFPRSARKLSMMGQTVTAIDLIANPHRDVEPLRAYVSQKAGQPYSQEAVESSIAVLQQRGKLRKS